LNSFLAIDKLVVLVREAVEGVTALLLVLDLNVSLLCTNNMSLATGNKHTANGVMCLAITRSRLRSPARFHYTDTDRTGLWASCSHPCASVTKQCDLVPV